MRGGGPGAPAAPAASAGPAPSPQGAGSATVPAGTTIPVLISGLISAATTRPGDVARGTVLQPVVVNGVSVIPANSTVSLQVVAAGDGLSVQLTGVTLNGGTIAAVSSQVALDPQTAAANAAMERAMAAMAASPGGAATQQALAGRLVVVSGARMNLPSGTRLMFTLAAPLVIEGAAAEPIRRPVTR